jgi:hypothetical protein
MKNIDTNNLHSIGSFDKEKSVYYLHCEVNRYKLDDENDREEETIGEYDYFVYAESFAEVNEIVKNNLETLIDETDVVNILEISKVKNIYLQLSIRGCHIDPSFNIVNFINTGKINPETVIIGIRKRSI